MIVAVMIVAFTTIPWVTSQKRPFKRLPTQPRQGVELLV